MSPTLHNLWGEVLSIRYGSLLRGHQSLWQSSAYYYCNINNLGDNHNVRPRVQNLCFLHTPCRKMRS
jgi:hypothetical protein